MTVCGLSAFRTETTWPQFRSVFSAPNQALGVGEMLQGLSVQGVMQAVWSQPAMGPVRLELRRWNHYGGEEGGPATREARRGPLIGSGGGHQQSLPQVTSVGGDHLGLPPVINHAHDRASGLCPLTSVSPADKQSQTGRPGSMPRNAARSRPGPGAAGPERDLPPR